MFCSKKNTFIIFILALNVFANAEKPAEGEHGAKPAAESGGHGGAAATGVEKNFSGKQNEEWLQVQAQLTTLKGKVETQKTLVEGLIMQKAHGGHGDDEQLKKEHAAWITMIEEYNKLSTSFQNRFPEKGAAFGRIYKRINPDNIEALENQMTAEGRMKRLNKKIKKQYRQDEKEAAAPTVNAHGVQTHTVESSVKKKKITEEIPVTDQIILQK